MIHGLGRFDNDEFEDLSGRDPAAVAEAAQQSARRGGFVWVGLSDPEGDELDGLADPLRLHPLAVADAATGKQQPKVQHYDEHLFVVLWRLTQTDPTAEIELSQVLIFARDGLLVTVQHGAGGQPLDVAELLGSISVDIEQGAAGALYLVMNDIVTGYTLVADNIENALEKLEEHVFDGTTREDGRSIYRLRQQLGRVQRAIAAAAAAVDAGREHLQGLSVGGDKIEPYFRDLLDDLVGTAQLVSDQDRALEGVLATHENNLALQQSDDTRKISALAALLSVPAVLAGLFGMNFKNLPGVNWSLGWVVLIAAVIVIDVVLFVAFRRRKWL